jgi:hypothetical protein
MDIRLILVPERPVAEKFGTPRKASTAEWSRTTVRLIRVSIYAIAPSLRECAQAWPRLHQRWARDRYYRYSRLRWEPLGPNRCVLECTKASSVKMKFSPHRDAVELLARRDRFVEHRLADWPQPEALMRTAQLWPKVWET